MSNNLKDPYERRINYLRISITDRCNLRCRYCSPKEGKARLGHNDILRYEEILRVVRIAVSLGIEKVRITGGEPLVRKGLPNFISILSQINGIRDIGLTTNGILLSQYGRELYDSGLKRINISLDSLKEDKYRFITGGGELKNVLIGLKTAREIGFSPIKINVVAIAGFNEDEILDFVTLAASFPYEVRFIELMPFHLDLNGRHLTCEEIKNKIEASFTLRPLDNNENPLNGPAKIYQIENGIGHVGFISPMTKHFCHNCNRLRITADGHLRACLFSHEEINIKKELREGCSDETLRSLLMEAVDKKPRERNLTTFAYRQKSCQRDMNSIGG
ncbi:MAG: GTP 3',8-cyclase MoaA [Syntrophales bacterium]|nr:GTP 3',8-cyclase MoaA [Syntrophales bacterium]